MQDFDYVIIGGGCAGLSLAYSLEVNHKLRGKSLAIIEPREKYERDKSWSFWKTFEHGFDDCVKKSWTQFEIKTEKGTKSAKKNIKKNQRANKKSHRWGVLVMSPQGLNI